MSRLIVIKHEVDGVGLGSEEKEFEGGVVDRASGKGPEDVWWKAVSIGD